MDIVNMCREISCIYTSLCHQVVFELCFAKYLLSSKYFHYFFNKNSAIKVVKCLETLLAVWTITVGKHVSLFMVMVHFRERFV